MQKIAIIGASSGIGLALAKMLEKDHVIYAFHAIAGNYQIRRTLSGSSWMQPVSLASVICRINCTAWYIAREALH